MEAHRPYLEKYCQAKNKKLKELINNSSDKQLELLCELFLNLDSFVVTNKDRKPFGKYKRIINKFVKTKWTLAKAKNFFIKNCKLLALVVVSFLSKFVEGYMCHSIINHV